MTVMSGCSWLNCATSALPAIDIFGSSPDHIPELDVNVFFGLAAKRADQNGDRSGDGRDEQPRPPKCWCGPFIGLSGIFPPAG